MAETYDVVVIGGGVVGAATAFHLAKFGAGRVALVERGRICTGGTAKSCAIVRTHYSIPSNTALTVKTLEIFANFQDQLGDTEAESGFVNSGYLIVAGAGDFADAMKANLEKQTDAGADTWVIPPEEALERHPWLNLRDAAVIGYEPNSGYADPYLTTSSFVRAARTLGVTVKEGCPAHGLITKDGRVTGVRTADGPLHAGQVLTAIGPWSNSLANGIDLDLPLEISRHIVLTFRTQKEYGRMLPVVKDLVTENKMYFRPTTGGVVLVGTGDHGNPVDHADEMDENIAADFVELQGTQIAHRMPAFAEGGLTDSWIGAYDITPDWNPVLGAVPGYDGLYMTFGFSGHGFKLAPGIGYMLAKEMLGQKPEIDLHPYRFSRFDEGELLTGSYGIGSIS